MRLVYLSPVRWSSFEQRPHKFVRWYHSRFQAPVLWIDPYPARLPRLGDLARVQRALQSARMMEQPPKWLRVVHTYALPIEPLPGVAHINRSLWAGVVAEVSRFIGSDEAVIMIGKPSLLALQIQAGFSRCATIYDAMDNFPYFHAGMAQRAMLKCEQQLVSRVDMAWASSRTLQQRLSHNRCDVRLVPNGLDPALLPAPIKLRTASPVVFGYVGTMADWFDWEIIVALARARPHDRVRLIGPMDVRPAMPLPANIELLPAMPHAQALHAMNTFNVGLIPFKRNALTDSVDPIKYYEYRALRLPVLSTEFGEMANRRNAPGVHLIQSVNDISKVAFSAACDDAASDPYFVQHNSWDTIFSAAWMHYVKPDMTITTIT